VVIVDPGRSGGGAEHRRDLRILAAFLGPKEKDLPLKPGQLGEPFAYPVLRFAGCQIAVWI
jgi:hypothetical protein